MVLARTRCTSKLLTSTRSLVKGSPSRVGDGTDLVLHAQSFDRGQAVLGAEKLQVRLRHHGAYDISTLSDAVRTARTRTLISSPASHRARPDQPSPQPQNAEIWRASASTGTKPLIPVGH